MKPIRLALAFTAAVVLLSGCGKNEVSTSASPSAVMPSTAAPAAKPSIAENAAGKSVYGKTCALCHAAGVAGAPKPGDKSDWGPRIAQGKETLYQHALDGFTGTKGAMPARGGAPTLSDSEVKAAVDFMADQSN